MYYMYLAVDNTFNDVADLRGITCAINILIFHHSIAAVKSPVIIMHAEDDLVIPYDLGLKVSTDILGKLPYTCTACRSRDCLSICFKN